MRKKKIEQPTDAAVVNGQSDHTIINIQQLIILINKKKKKNYYYG